jgi:hypothetical protein
MQAVKDAEILSERGNPKSISVCRRMLYGLLMKMFGTGNFRYLGRSGCVMIFSGGFL